MDGGKYPFVSSDQMNIGGLEINSPEYWELRHQRDHWPRWSWWAMSLVFDSVPVAADVLICCCGQGMEAIELRKHRPDVGRILAFDISSTAIDKAHLNMTKEGVEGIEFKVLDMFELSSYVKKNTFDYVVSIQNMEHWRPERHRDALVQKVLPVRGGGKIFVTGVGRAWDISDTNYSPMVYNGKTIQTPNDYHYMNWNEQDLYDMAVSLNGVRSVKFYKRRRKNRIIAEIEKE